MRVFLKKRSPNRIEFGILYGFIALIALCAGRFLPNLAFLPSCAFRGLTGMPCPTCGATRSVVHLAHGNIIASVAMNPLVAVFFFAAILYLLYSLITFAFSFPRLCITLIDTEKDALRAAAVVVIVVNWAYLIFIV
jgi:hypothetical protein